MHKLFYCAAAACLAAQAHAQTKSAPQPPPELKALNYFAGKLSCEGATKPANERSAGTMQCAWFKGGFVLECRARMTAPTESEGVYVYGYSPVEKAYTLYSYGSSGANPSVYKGQREGKAWTFTREGTYTGKPARYQLHMTEDPGGKASYQWRRAAEGGPWTVTSEGSCSIAK